MNLQAAKAALSDVLRLRHYSWQTEKSYLYWLEKFVCWIRKAPAPAPAMASSEKRVEAFLTELAHSGVAAPTQNQAFNAILFFYKHVLKTPLQEVKALRAKQGQRVRSVPSFDDVRRLLPAVENQFGYPTNLIARLLYGCGLRVSEAMNLRARDLLFRESQAIIRGAKGNKDRVVSLPCSLIVEIKSELDAARGMWRRDAAAGLPVKLPGRLDKKYPSAPFLWEWYWLFPARKPCRDPRTGERVKYHLHENTIRRALRAACGKIGLEPAVRPHDLRHAYATHVIQRGAAVTDLKEAMGHKFLETTMGYVSSSGLKVPSPLEAVPA